MTSETSAEGADVMYAFGMTTTQDPEMNTSGIFRVNVSGDYMAAVYYYVGDLETTEVFGGDYAAFSIDIENNSSSNPGYDDDEDLPPFVPGQTQGSDDDSVTIVACAAAAVVAALMAVFLIVSYRKD